PPWLRKEQIMALSKVKALQVSIRSFKSTIDAETSEKGGHVSIQLAKHYNSLRGAAAQFPDLRDHLPPEISLESNFAMMGGTDARYTDLKVYLNQLMSLTDQLGAEDEA